MPPLNRMLRQEAILIADINFARILSVACAAYIVFFTSIHCLYKKRHYFCLAKSICLENMVRQ